MLSRYLLIGNGTSYSDKVIEEALGRFDIKVLDYHKEDLDP